MVWHPVRRVMWTAPLGEGFLECGCWLHTESLFLLLIPGLFCYSFLPVSSPEILFWGIAISAEYSISQCAHQWSVLGASATSVITHSGLLWFPQNWLLLPHSDHSFSPLQVWQTPGVSPRPIIHILLPGGLAHDHCPYYFVSRGVGPFHQAVEIQQGIISGWCLWPASVRWSDMLPQPLCAPGAGTCR